MQITTCGIFLIDKDNNLLLCHPTGARRNSISIPKGINENTENYKETAIRELFEETGIVLTDEDIFKLEYLGEEQYQHKNKKIISFYLKVDKSYNSLKCNSFFERNGKQNPEVDYYVWLNLEDAMVYLHHTQQTLLKKLAKEINYKFIGI